MTDACGRSSFIHGAVWLCVALALASCGQSEPEDAALPVNPAAADVPAETPFIPAAATLEVSARPLSETRVQFRVSTNIPPPIEVMAAVSFPDQADDSTYIGYNQRVRLTGLVTMFTLDLSRSSRALPRGRYDAEVHFYPRWGAAGNPAAQEAPELQASTQIVLEGSGQSRASAERRDELQQWVMSNLDMNTPWNENEFVARLGRYESTPSTMSRLHEALYFPDADMTLIVNRVRNEVTIWRMGRTVR